MGMSDFLSRAARTRLGDVPGNIASNVASAGQAIKQGVSNVGNALGNQTLGGVAKAAYNSTPLGVAQQAGSMAGNMIRKGLQQTPASPSVPLAPPVNAQIRGITPGASMPQNSIGQIQQASTAMPAVDSLNSMQQMQGMANKMQGPTIDNNARRFMNTPGMR
jgi:hypothetical protein